MTSNWMRVILDGNATPEWLQEIFPWAEAMAACPQDSLYHAEGDVWTHTSMVAAELEASEGFLDLPEPRRDALRLAAWFHDVAKPRTTEISWCDVEKRERVRQPYHAPIGAGMAWQALNDAGCDAALARDVHALVFWHQRPTHLLEQKDPLSRVIRFTAETQETTWSDLLRFCRSDQRGRISPNVAEGLLDLEVVEEMIREESVNAGADLLEAAWPFASPSARLRMVRGGKDANPWFTPQEPTGSRMILLSGLPGSGKDTLARDAFPGIPMVSLDRIREQMGVSPTDDQGRVRQAGIEAARVHLRRGEPFIWNATCVSRSTREKIVGIALDYDAKVEAHALDVPLFVALERNRKRKEPVPDAVIARIASKREPLGADEAHEIWSWDAEQRPRQIKGMLKEADDPQPDPV